MTPVTNDQLRRLLLKRLGAEEVARLEEAILTEDGVAERLREAEFDLIDDYARGRLSEAERADMGRYVLTTPEQLESLRVARALSTQRPPAVIRPRWDRRRALPIAALLAAGLAALAVIPYWGVNTGLSLRPAPVADSVPVVVPGARPSVERAPDQTITLLTDTNRGGSRPVVRLASDAVIVRLQAEVPGPPRNVSYSIRVDDAVGTAVFERSHLATHVAGPYAFVEAAVPSEVFGPSSSTIYLTVDGAPATTAPEYRWQINIVRDGTPE